MSILRNKENFFIAFPYLCGLIMVAILVVGGLSNRIGAAPESMLMADAMPPSGNGDKIDVVCQMKVGDAISSEYGGKKYYFCSKMCKKMFDANPKHYIGETCTVCRSERKITPVDASSEFQAHWQGKSYRFCGAAHLEKFRSDPAGYFMHSMWGIPNWLYYTSISLVLVLSFGLIEWKENSSEAPKGNPRPEAPPTEPGSYAKIDLLKSATLKRIVTHPATRPILQLGAVAMFLTILGAGLFGNQMPSKNIAPLITWTVWWGGLVVLIMYLGKAWCFVCPWDAIADWSESVRLWGKKRVRLGLGLKWPKWMSNIWPAIILFVGLTWLELGFQVTMNPRATAWMGLIMLALAFVSAFVFDRKSFCRYGCLVGRISGLYALFAPIEIRSADKGVCRSCKSHSCHKGSDAGEACPTFEHPAVMDQNTYCISCMECVKTCDKGNIALNLRPWGADLVNHKKPRSDEAYLALIMLSLTGFHGLTMTAKWRDVTAAVDGALSLGPIMSFSIGMAIILVAPAILYAILVGISRYFAGSTESTYREQFIRYAYALLPIALFYHLAHNSEHLLMEGQKVVALLSDPFGFEWNVFGTSTIDLQPLVTLETLWILQVFLVMVGHIYSLWAARRAAGAMFGGDSRRAALSQAPMLAAMILFSVMSLWLLKQPMEMRNSWM